MQYFPPGQDIRPPPYFRTTEERNAKRAPRSLYRCNRYPAPRRRRGMRKIPVIVKGKGVRGPFPKPAVPEILGGGEKSEHEHSARASFSLSKTSVAVHDLRKTSRRIIFHKKAADSPCDIFIFSGGNIKFFKNPTAGDDFIQKPSLVAGIQPCFPVKRRIEIHRQQPARKPTLCPSIQNPRPRSRKSGAPVSL